MSNEETVTEEAPAEEVAATEVPLIRIQQYRSPIGYAKPQREVLRTLGLRRMWHVVERQDTPAVRGAVKKIQHLARILED